MYESIIYRLYIDVAFNKEKIVRWEPMKGEFDVYISRDNELRLAREIYGYTTFPITKSLYNV